MSRTRRSGMLISSLQGPQHRIEEEPEPGLAFELCFPALESPKTTQRENSAGLSFSLLGVLERNQRLEQRMAKSEKVVAEGNERSVPSRPLAISSASVALQRRNAELENQLARLENLRMKEYRVPGEDLIPTVWSEGSVRCFDPVQQILMDKRRDERIRNIELRKMLQQAQELDLAFLVDATGSMTRSIIEVKNLVPKIATDVKKAFPKLKLRVAFVPYRDYGQHNQDEADKCDFTDSFEGPESVFVSAIAKVKAIRNADDAEDVFSGLERVATLSWSSKTRVLIHIADMPCHGEEFHDGVRDNYPNGDCKGRDIGKLLAALRHDCQILNYLFCHITNHTKKMMKLFRERAPQGGWIHEEKLDKISNLLEVVVSASCGSITVSSRIVGEGPSVFRYLPIVWKKEIPQWNNIKRQKGVQFSYKLPATLEDLFKIVDKNRPLTVVLEQKPAITVQIALRPFSDEGNLRWPYYAQVHEAAWTPPSKMVVKRFKELLGEDVSKVHTIEAYCEQMEVQTVAAFMAEHFNHELERLSGLTDYKTVQFTAVSVLQVGVSKYYNMENVLEGTWIRYSNNVNYVNTKEYAATLHAFSHWTYQRSNGLLMVTDLQGVQVVDSEGKKVFMLCDPAVHCKHVYRYARTKTNWSTAGMESFFETHQCNNICRSLRLQPKSSSFTCEGTVIN